MKNMFLVLMISQGTPMILSGDEVKFSKNGNNNSYCHDNELNWFNWKLVKKNKDFFDFCKFTIGFRKKHPVLRINNFLIDKDVAWNSEYIKWHGVEIDKPDFTNGSHTIAFVLYGSKYNYNNENKDKNIYVAINSFWEDLNFNIPVLRMVNGIYQLTLF